ncbi:MAG TPA: hypothetical protein VD866_25110 [Urbifossiella sp.]|nr:hypothetical protein [Urbifossiella sp.]
MRDVPKHIRDAAGGDPGASRAAEFVRDFDPKSGVDYGWVEDHARRLYEQAVGVFDALDAKAGAVIGHVGVGAGFATFGTAAAAASTSVHPLVLLAAIPTVVLAAAAVWNAARCRRTSDVHRAPGADVLVGIAERHPAEARAYLIPQWHLCTALLMPAIRRKAELVDAATRDFALAVLGLAFPLAAIVITRLSA